MNYLKLTKPMAFVDVEATGLKFSTDRVVSIAIMVLQPDLSTEDIWYTLINPGMPIPPESTAIHGITDAMVANAPTFKEVAGEITSLLVGRDICGYNVPFDLQMIDGELDRCGSFLDLTGVLIVDPGMIFKKKEERTLTAAFRFYCGKEMGGAHNAAHDIKATAEVLFGQLQYYPDLPRDVQGLAELSKHDNNIDLAGKFIRNEKGEAIINFGDSRGMPVSENVGILSWVLKKDFPADTKRVCRKLLDEFNRLYSQTTGSENGARVTSASDKQQGLPF